MVLSRVGHAKIPIGFDDAAGDSVFRFPAYSLELRYPERNPRCTLPEAAPDTRAKGKSYACSVLAIC